MSDRPGGRVVADVPTSSGRSTICDIAVEWDIPVISKGGGIVELVEHDDIDVGAAADVDNAVVSVVDTDFSGVDISILTLQDDDNTEVVIFLSPSSLIEVSAVVPTTLLLSPLLLSLMLPFPKSSS
mmetsp:Transcript_17153/g.25614  ORF Transcript_17153/g.25614 Transcript_17153/m.25614 type:complete len:126 (-) Transcript_17153:1712-2089(-)